VKLTVEATQIIHAVSIMKTLNYRGMFEQLNDTWCDYYKVPGMTSFLDFKGAMRLDRNKVISMHISTCTSYDFKALTPAVWKLWL
jgi:hypothetical protein